MEYLNCHHTNPLAPMYSCTCTSSTHDPHDTIRELQTYFCWVPVSGTSALQVTWGCTEANRYSRGPGQKLRLWPSPLLGRTAAWWGRIISDLSKQCTRGANHLNSPHPHFSTIWTALQTPGTHPTTFQTMQDTECVDVTHAALRPFYSHKELIWN